MECVILSGVLSPVIPIYRNKAKSDAHNQPVAGWPIKLLNFITEESKHQKS